MSTVSASWSCSKKGSRRVFIRCPNWRRRSLWRLSLLSRNFARDVGEPLVSKLAGVINPDRPPVGLDAEGRIALRVRFGEKGLVQPLPERHRLSEGVGVAAAAAL